MVNFKYSALDSLGQNVNGQLEARDENSAFSTLIGRGLSPISVQARTEGLGLSRLKRIRPKDLAMMTRQIAVLLSAGISLTETMSSLANGASHPALAERAGRVRASLRAGERFSACLLREFPTLPPYVPQMAELGEATGRLGPALMEAADQFDYDQEIASEVRSALTYPLFLLCAGSVIVSIMFVFVVPRFADLVSQSNASVPTISKWVIGFSMWFSTHWLLAIIGAAMLGGLFYWGVRSMKGGLAGIAEHIPIIKKYQAVSTLARWCRILGGALQQGSGIMPALELAERGVNAPQLRAGLAAARTSVRGGEGLDEAIARNIPGFDSVAIDMIRTGRTSGQLADMMLFAAEIYRRETQERTKKLTALVEPLAIVSISLIVGTIVISIVLAMTSLYEIAP
ncbi:type II secretion system F family protein [Hyphomonas oceanitis]|uniref:type II secretion system F family protein n=1 Tax=Hyphomonas oceanitis TaxID=81033 RepID=UPI0030012BC3